MSSIQPYQGRVPIGTVQKDGTVLASVALIRYMQFGWDRAGGSDAPSNTDLADLSAAAAQAPAPLLDNQEAALSALGQLPPTTQAERIEYLETQLAALASEVTDLRQQIANLETA